MDKGLRERLKKRADVLFEKKGPVMSQWQELADQFYPERADFSVTRSPGADIASNLQTSYPVVIRRELGNAIASMLRYDEWFDVTTNREEKLDHDAKAWLQEATLIQRRAMEDRDAMFDRATKEGDHDFATFGQCAISTQFNRSDIHLQFNCWHLRDMVWCEDAHGKIFFIARKWKPFACDLKDMFPKTLSPETTGKMTQDPYCEIEVMHIVIASKYLHEAKDLQRHPWTSLFIETKDCHELEAVNSKTPIYNIPRWQTVSGSQYAFSPAAIIALPDARLLQTMTGTLLRAGMKAVDPPLAARSEVIRSDMQMYPGGVTWLDAEHDERLGPALQLLESGKHGIPFGIEMSQQQIMQLKEAFFLNKLTMPFPEREITAYEAGKRVAEYIRQALPLWRPTEIEYNGGLCETTFQVLMDNGAFPPLPRSLLGQEIKFKFRTPLREAAEQKKMFQLRQAKEMVVTMVDLDKTVVNIIDANKAVRDAIEGNRTPQDWLRSPEDAEALAEQQREAEAAAATLAELEQGGKIIKDVATANRDLSEAA